MIPRPLILIAAAVLAGCTITTPDGVSLRKGSDEATVRAALGEPDWTRSFDAVGGRFSGWGHPTGKELNYVDRGYGVTVFDWGLSHVYKFPPNVQADMERQRRAYRQTIPLVRAGRLIGEIVEQFGEPEVVTEEWTEGKLDYCRHMTYAQFAARSPSPPTVVFLFPAPDVAVRFEGGRVVKAEPIYDFQWKQILNRDPPTVDPGTEGAHRS